METITKQRLFCPGPTPTPQDVKASSLTAEYYHRGSKFRELFTETARQLKPFFGTEQTPLILAASGTGAMEAAVTNLTNQGDHVVTVNAGKFGERWSEIAKTYDCQVDELYVDRGTAPTAAQIIAKLDGAKALFLQATESSTGVYLPLEELLPEIRKTFSGLIVVDAISSLVAKRMKMDEWQIDCVIGGSQKGFGIPPGLSFITLSKGAWNHLSSRSRYYFNLEKERSSQAEGNTAFTPAVSLVVALKSSIEKMLATGLDEIELHHARMSRAAQAAVAAIKLKVFAENPSPALTVAELPKSIDALKLVKKIYHTDQALLSGGQNELKSMIIRLAHLGFCDRLELLSGICALEFGLCELGHEFTLGSGVSAAMQSLAQD